MSSHGQGFLLIFRGRLAGPGERKLEGVRRAVAEELARLIFAEL
ncbi:MAG TPA: hypothetical protein VIL34_02360 [Actinopolymorphaceae bacterium]|jgi:hypothetical protein